MLDVDKRQRLAERQPINEAAQLAGGPSSAYISFFGDGRRRLRSLPQVTVGTDVRRWG
jgi:hypothetical protein